MYSIFPLGINNNWIVQWGNYTGPGNLIITFPLSFNTDRYTCITNFRDTTLTTQIGVQHVSVWNTTKTQATTRLGASSRKGIIAIGF